MLEYQVTLYSAPIQREGLTSARYSTQNFKSSEEPLIRTEKEIHIRISNRVKASLGTAGSLIQEVVCGASRNKREGIRAECSAEHSSLTPGDIQLKGFCLQVSLPQGMLEQHPQKGDPLMANGQMQGAVCIPEGLLCPQNPCVGRRQGSTLWVFS